MRNLSLESCSRCETWCAVWAAMTMTSRLCSSKMPRIACAVLNDLNRFLSYRTGEYKLHYYETPTSMKFVMLSDIKTQSLRVVLHQIWANLYVEYVVRNPLSPVEHPRGTGVNNELFEMGLDRFIVCPSKNEEAPTNARVRVKSCRRDRPAVIPHCIIPPLFRT